MEILAMLVSGLVIILIAYALYRVLYKIISHYVFKENTPRWLKIVLATVSVAVVLVFSGRIAYILGTLAGHIFNLFTK